MRTKLAKDIQVNEVIVEGIHRIQVLNIVSTNQNTITYAFKVISDKSKGFGNSGTEYKRLNTKIKVI